MRNGKPLRESQKKKKKIKWRKDTIFLGSYAHRVNSPYRHKGLLVADESTLLTHS